jgi:hypothetical protein
VYTITSQSSYLYSWTGVINEVTSAGTSSNGEAPGIEFALSICVPSLFSDNYQTPGTADSVQLVSWRTDPDLSSINTDGNFDLDNKYPYSDDLVVAPSSAEADNIGYNIECTHSDSPHNGLAADTTSFYVTNTFKDYFMYQPPGTDSIMVPLWETDWTWNAAASCASSSSAFMPYPPGQTAITSSNYTTTFPSWNAVLNTGG